MITVGLIKELQFMAKAYGTPIVVTLEMGLQNTHMMGLMVKPNHLMVAYKEHVIWSEEIETDTSMFGIESCDTIAKIVEAINEDKEWEHLKHIESP